ncbi:hypothetical protein [Actinoplanes sp. OR16]|uniref:hypothetical protein n=1 Tax=Actinoplanes sp. OR16 TaxID=946334 RepID=UPI000FD717D1|nr:hypothetical protein [Actinoplanes sp. OR16]
MIHNGVSPGRLAALLGAAGIAVHLALAGEHLGHAPAALAGLAVLALVCLPCGLRLWQRPADRAAWISLLAISGLMTLLHLGMRPQGAMLVTVLAVPIAQLLLGLGTLVRRRPAVPDPSRV